MRRLLSTLAFLCAFGLTVTVAAQPAAPPSAAATNPADECRTASGETAISACNRAIASGRFKGAALADIYVNRGKQWSAAADYDRAFADFDRAIEIDAQNPAAFDARGRTWLAKGDVYRAVADFDQAIRIDAAYAAAYAGRGLAYERRGERASARADFNAALALPLKSETDRWAHDTARERLAAMASAGTAAPPAPPSSVSLPAAKSTAAALSPTPTSDPNAAARRDYALANQVGSREGWEEFLKRYPNGFYSDLARAQLVKLIGLEHSKAAPVGEKDEPNGIAPREQAEHERLAKERLTREQAEKDRQTKEQAERGRLEKERFAREQAEKDRLAKAQAERERLEKERLAREQTERQRLEQERLAREQAEKDRQAKAQAERERLEKERAAREQPERDKAAAEAAATIKKAALTPPAENSLPPSPTRALSGSALIEEIEKELTRIGCYAGPINDGWTTQQTRASVRKFVKAVGASAAPDDPTLDFLDLLRRKSGRVCPLECGARKVESNGECVAKTCANGYELDEDGDCVRQKNHSAEKPRHRDEEEKFPPKRKARNEEVRPAHRNEEARSGGHGPHNTCLQPALCGDGGHD